MIRSVKLLGWLACGLFLTAPTLLAQPAAKSLPIAKPEEAGLDASAIAKLKARLQQEVDNKQASGVVTLIARDGKIISLEAVGFADVENKIPMVKESLFAIASMTKPIVSTGLMILVDEGKVSLDDPVSKYIPSFAEAAKKDGSKPAKPITVRQVLTHTSGLGGSQQNDGTLANTADKLGKRSLDFEPGTKWQYSPGITVAGRIVEVASGKPLDEFLATRIFVPLGMTDTTFRPTEQQAKRRAKIYQPNKEKTGIEPVNHWLGKEGSPNPSGGLTSSASDLARFYQMVLNGGELDGQRIVSKKAVEEMTRLQTGDLVTGFTPGNGWGLGWCVVQKPEGVTKSVNAGTFGHGGAFGTQGWVDPKSRTIYVLLVQRQNFGNADGSDLRGAIHDLTKQAIEK